MLKEGSRERDLNVHILYKRSGTNSGLVTAAVLAFIMEYPVTTLFIAVFAGLSAFPLMLFIALVVYIFFFAMLGFAMIEVTVVMSAFLLLGAVIFVLFFVALVITAFLAFTWSSAAIGHILKEKLQLIIHYFFPFCNFGLTSQMKQGDKHGLVLKGAHHTY